MKSRRERTRRFGARRFEARTRVAVEGGWVGGGEGERGALICLVVFCVVICKTIPQECVSKATGYLTLTLTLIVTL